MSHYTDEPRFTIEQIDLLQRLRRTGMTKPEIVHALDTLERLDREHGDKFSRRGPSDSNATNSTTSSTTPTSNNTSNATMATSSTTSTATQTQFHGNLSPSPSNSYATSPPAVLPSPVSLVAMAQNGRDTLAATPNGKLSPNRYPVNSAAAVRSYGLEGSEEDLDIDDKVEELMRRDSTLVKEEIKAFLGNRRISQAVVAQVTGISQSRISHWLLQQGSDLSEQKKRAFYRWYQLEKTTPDACTVDSEGLKCNQEKIANSRTRLFKDDTGNHADHQDPISLAVEMAAVNHSILALSHPEGVASEIKTESLDDD
uniref:Homeobox containing 1 n=1 Tax=Sinocyclocheilus grahami TaxID=75366 RepID=A0A672P1R0_SINGR